MEFEKTERLTRSYRVNVMNPY